MDRNRYLSAAFAENLRMIMVYIRSDIRADGCRDTIKLLSRAVDMEISNDEMCDILAGEYG